MFHIFPQPNFTSIYLNLKHFSTLHNTDLQLYYLFIYPPGITATAGTHLAGILLTYYYQPSKQPT